jgi:hypothetical protein
MFYFCLALRLCALQADASWGGGTWVGTAATFIFKLGTDGAASERFDPRGADENYQLASLSYWPTWGGGGDDLNMWGNGGALGGNRGYCNQNTYTAATNQVCGGGTGTWGATDLVVFGRLPVRCDPACQAAQKPALLAFKASGNGNGLESWDPAAGNPCAGGWVGVTCDGDAGVVTRLELQGPYNTVFHGLTGALGTLGGLVGLQFLDLAKQDGITGTLSDLASMVGLTHLDLSGYEEGAVSGGDLSDLASMAGLTHLDLESCLHVTGDLGTLGGLVGLDYLSLAYCPAVTGDVGALGELVGLDTLFLASTMASTAVTGDVGALAGCGLHDYLGLQQTAVTGYPLRTTGGCTFDDEWDHSC